MVVYALYPYYNEIGYDYYNQDDGNDEWQADVQNECLG